MRKLSIIFFLVLMASIILPQLDTAEAQDDKYASYIGVVTPISNNTDVRYTGNHYDDAKGITRYEYKARVQEAPIYNNDGTPVDCSWHLQSAGKGQNISSYSIINNVFSATVTDSAISTTYNGQTMSWNPVVMVDSAEYKALGEAKILDIDPINENYRDNTLEWDYGVCDRRVRVIEGLIQETWVFSENPRGTVWIKDNLTKSAGFIYVITPYAYDSAIPANSLVINQYKQVMASEFDRIEKEGNYPVIIDPTTQYVTSVDDGYMSGACTCSSYTSITNTTTTFGMGDGGATYYRPILFFNTSSLPDSSTISSANVSLRGQSDGSSTDFWVSFVNGMPTYPHLPVVATDFDRANYTGRGNIAWYTSGFTYSYFNISLNATGISWINLTGITKLVIRTSNDFNCSLSNTRVDVYSYEQGVGYWPYLEVIYTSITNPPAVTTNPATYVTKSTARLNGYLNDDGGDVCNMSFEYYINEFANNDFETGDPPTSWNKSIATLRFNNSSLTKMFGTYSGNVTRNGTNAYIFQNISSGNLSKYRGLNVTFSIYANTSSLNNSYIGLSDNSSSSYSTNQSNMGNWSLLSVSKSINASASYINISAWVANSSTNASVFYDYAMLSVGGICPNITANESKHTGEYMQADLTGLIANTSYCFRVKATNSLGTTCGSWSCFTTASSLDPPTIVNCRAEGTSILLSWTRNTSSPYTYIRYKAGEYPTSLADGYALPVQSGNGYEHTGLVSGTSYYYKLWGYDGSGYSTSNITTMCTTGVNSSVPTAGPLPTPNSSGWQATPNGSVLTGNPLYPLGNLEAAAIGVPQSTWWMLIGLGGLVVTGLFIYTRSQGNLLAAVGAMMIFGVIMSQMGIFPIWVMYVFGLAGIGLSWKELR